MFRLQVVFAVMILPDVRRVRLPTGQLLLPWPMVTNEPPREVTFPIRPQDVSVGLFAAAILQNISGMDRTGQICQYGSGSAGRSVCLLDFKASRYALNIKRLFQPPFLFNRLLVISFRTFKTPHFCSGFMQVVLNRLVFFPQSNMLHLLFFGPVLRIIQFFLQNS